MSAPSIRATIEPEDTPARQGLRKTLSLAVHNDGPGVLVLDQAVGDDPHDDVLRWRRHPEGVVVYDAGEDVYRHHSAVAARAHVPLCHLIVRPGSTGRTFYAARSLAVGPRRVRVRVTGHLVSMDDAGDRVYASPERMHGATTVYRRAEDEDELGGIVIARCGRDGRVEVTAEVDLEVEADPSAAAALEQAGPDAALRERVRRLGNAWVAATPAGATTLVDDARALRLARGVVDPAVWRRLDDVPPSAPVLVMFRSDAARALRDQGGLALEGLDTAQQHLAPAALWDLLAACDARGLHVTWGRHSAVTDGLIVR